MIIIIALVNGNSSTSFKIGWISIVLVLPIVGHIMYILWGDNSRNKENVRVNAKFSTAYRFIKDEGKIKKRPAPF